ncbi:ras/Rap GTPase-activating protein SynGAP isoform X3 [Cyprinodon tularosa]|nr:ras/Rap GTPase-activating protein SynGAP isoform X3 [Cyprinodon tularosa]
MPMEQLVKHLSRCRHLGWMEVIELKSASIHWLSCGQKAEPDVWTRMFCILSDSQLLMLDDLEVHPLLLTERAETCTIWLLRYTLHVTPAAPGSAQKDVAEKRIRRQSMPSGSMVDRPPTRVTGFLSHRLKQSLRRTRSQPKLSRHISLKSDSTKAADSR